VVDAQGPITAERIAGATGMSEPDVRLEPKLIVNKELKCFIHVACHSAHASSPNSDAVACHRQTPALNLEHRVACHISTPTSPNPSTVACLTEGVVIQKEMTTSIGMTGPDVRKGLEPLASKELKGITRVACHKKRIVNRRLPKALKKNSYPLTKNRLRKQELWHATLKAL
jgi:hypothetical protein